MPEVAGSVQAVRGADRSFWTEADHARLVEMKRRYPLADPEAQVPGVPPTRVPRHIAIVMDGNGRWAKANGVPAIFGHRSGAHALRRTVELCGPLGIEALTVYSFSTENWKRDGDEVHALMLMAASYLEGECEAFVENNIRFRHIGDIDGLPGEVRDGIRAAENRTAACTGPTLCVALNYGSREEIVNAARKLAHDAAAGKLKPEQIDACCFERKLYTAGLPDPDLLIRTGGDMRISNYLLWQLSYAEIYVTDTLWPDFSEDDLRDAVRAFAARQRRFGGRPNDNVEDGA
ncbi:MAG: polyprenyl diphosphate synthase [Planctomycetota bacterium]